MQFEVRRVQTLEDQQRAFELRRRVFVEEQGVSEAEEYDGLDGACHHVLVLADGRPAGTGRWRPQPDEPGVARLERIAVLAELRGNGVGALVTREMMRWAKEEGYTQAYLHAQEHALGFYAKLGFVAEGERFMDANIPHFSMRASLSPA